jgi:hypothetical protein
MAGKRRKPNHGDPRNHPGNDLITVVCPSESMLTDEGAEPVSVDIARDEFQRRMAGSHVLDTLHASGRNTRVILLLEPDAIIQWWDTAP